MADHQPFGLVSGGLDHVDKGDTHCIPFENSHVEEQHSSRGDRWRELFPIPLCPEEGRAKGCSVSSRRRRAKVQRFVRDTNSAIQALNEMYAPSLVDEFFPPSCTRAQRLAQHELFKEVSKMKEPTTVLSEREAVQELLQTDLSYSGEVTTTVRAYDRGLLSIPTSGSSAVELASVIDEIGREIIMDPKRCMLKSDEEVGVMMESTKPICTYMDPSLRDNLDLYCVFIEDLYKCGMIDFTVKPSGLVTPFCVAKKNGRHRLILDCRETNRLFKDPPPLAMGTGASWARISVPEGKKLYVAQSDLKDYFYSLQLPTPLRTLFSLPSVPTHLLRRLGVALELLPGAESSGWVHPMLLASSQWVGVGLCI